MYPISLQSVDAINSIQQINRKGPWNKQKHLIMGCFGIYIRSIKYKQNKNNQNQKKTKNLCWFYCNSLKELVYGLNFFSSSMRFWCFCSSNKHVNIGHNIAWYQHFMVHWTPPRRHTKATASVIYQWCITVGTKVYESKFEQRVKHKMKYHDTDGNPVGNLKAKIRWPTVISVWKVLLIETQHTSYGNCVQCITKSLWQHITGEADNIKLFWFFLWVLQYRFKKKVCTQCIQYK